MASSSGTNLPDPTTTTTAGAVSDCESCRSAPGIPFCRVEWSFLCAGCAAVVHANNWIIAVPPNTNPNPNPNSNPSSHHHHHPYPFPFQNPNPSSDPNLVVHVSSDDDERGGGRRGRRRSGGKAAPPLRVESVMRYREKRKSRKFEKTVRYETRKVYAEQRPRVDGKFARPEGSGVEEMLGADEEGVMGDAVFGAMPSGGDGGREDVMPVGGEELGLMDDGEELRLL